MDSLLLFTVYDTPLAVYLSNSSYFAGNLPHRQSLPANRNFQPAYYYDRKTTNNSVVWQKNDLI